MTLGELTGRTRYRVQERLMREPLLVLQVEWEMKVGDYEDSPLAGSTSRGWRDARLEDFRRLKVNSVEVVF